MGNGETLRTTLTPPSTRRRLQKSRRKIINNIPTVRASARPLGRLLMYEYAPRRVFCFIDGFQKKLNMV